MPAVTGTCCCPASEPAMARTKTTGRKRPNNIARPSAVLYQVVWAARPAKADPLLLAAEVNA